jgi:hypothetical protein
MRRFRDNRPFCVSSHVDGRLSLVNCLRCPLSPVSRHFSFPIVLAISTYTVLLRGHGRFTVLIAVDFLHVLLLTRPGFVNADWLCKDLLPPIQRGFQWQLELFVISSHVPAQVAKLELPSPIQVAISRLFYMFDFSE